MNWVFFSLWLFCTGPGWDMQTLEVRYYQPQASVTEQRKAHLKFFTLVCNSRRSLFNYRPDSNAGEGETVHLGAWITKDLNAGLSTQFAKSFQGNAYLIEDPVHPMQWELSKEHKSIGGILVRKARCNYRGRRFVVWFAPSIPLDNGPWKLGGLPGLILEASDDKGEVVFLFHSLNRLGRQSLHLPDWSGRKVEMETYIAINKKELKQYLDLMEIRLRNIHADIEFELDIEYFSSWEYPD